MKKIFKLTLITLTAILLRGCCLIDHTKTIEKVAESMLNELQQFYKEHKRYPNTKERDVMLKKSGCEMKGDVCFFEGKKLHVMESGKEINGNYYFRIGIYKKGKKKTLASCGFPIYSNGHKSSFICSKRSCIELRQ